MTGCGDRRGNAARLRARELAARPARAGDETGWFETLYAQAETGAGVVPWADGNLTRTWSGGPNGSDSAVLAGTGPANGRWSSGAGSGTTPSPWPGSASR